ncbi:MAG: hypothetical protein NZ772_14070 [Cyanobacteria bacterium]|nr:hypothetical protein [Cyanobacteriota bacterium]MDW8202521.1 hypothetical protein [Cyanobacteriota bacterium SKYGB_h_bin112]
MKLVKQTAVEMILQEGVTLSPLLCIWVVGLIVVPLFLSYTTLTEAAIATLSCQRISSDRVNCEYQKASFFGLVKQTPIQLEDVRDVRLDQKTYHDDEGAYQAYQMRVVTRRGELAFTDFLPDYRQLSALEFSLKEFLGSKEQSIQLSHDTRWFFWRTLLPLSVFTILLSIGSTIVYGLLKTRTLTLDRRTNRAIYHTRTLLGNHYQYVSLRNVRGIDIREEVDDGVVYYEPVFLPLAANKFPMLRTKNMAEAQRLVERIRTFLQLP